jgi:pimeloyl-ACP methyl ester carboxylesterase
MPAPTADERKFRMIDNSVDILRDFGAHSHNGRHTRLDVSCNVGPSIDSEGTSTVVARVVVPEHLPAAPVALCCVPGGGTSRYYFDLFVGEDTSYSFADYAADRGFVTIAVDNLGTGDSLDSGDAMLTPVQVARANSAAFIQVVEALRAGGLTSSLGAVPIRTTLGVGHSMGGMLTIIAEATEPMHEGIAVLGFSVDGLPDEITDNERHLVNGPGRWTGELEEAAVRRFSNPQPPRSEGPFPFYLDSTPQHARRALAATRVGVLPLPGLLSMIPGNVADLAERITTPVFLGGGDHEPWHRAERLTGSFTQSSDITFYVLADSAHNHNLAAERKVLWKRLLSWAGATAAFDAEPA